MMEHQLRVHLLRQNEYNAIILRVLLSDYSLIGLDLFSLKCTLKCLY